MNTIMHEYFPLLFVGAVVGVFSTVFIVAFALMKDKKEAFGFDRNMKDSELVRRLAHYGKPYIKQFLLALFLMLVSIGYDIASPLLVGYIEEMIKVEFEIGHLIALVIVYASILVISLVCSYIQRILLQKTGQKIISALREDLFTHIESLSHEQLNHIPVGKLVTRVSNDTGGVSMLFTNFLVNVFRNIFILAGVLVAMSPSLE